MDKAGSPWTVPVSVDDIPDTGLHMEIAASPEIRAAVAELAGLRDLPSLTAAFDLVRQGSGAHVSGKVLAKVGQTCVVTLEPIENAIDEAVDVAFAPRSATTKRNAVVSAEEAEDEPEPLTDGIIDLGALAIEFLLLGIDPYPRKPGAEFVAPAGAEEGERPFAALAALKDRLGGGKA